MKFISWWQYFLFLSFFPFFPSNEAHSLSLSSRTRRPVSFEVAPALHSPSSLLLLLLLLHLLFWLFHRPYMWWMHAWTKGPSRWSYGTKQYLVLGHTRCARLSAVCELMVMKLSSRCSVLSAAVLFLLEFSPSSSSSSFPFSLNLLLSIQFSSVTNFSFFSKIKSDDIVVGIKNGTKFRNPMKQYTRTQSNRTELKRNCLVPVLFVILSKKHIILLIRLVVQTNGTVFLGKKRMWLFVSSWQQFNNSKDQKWI